MRNNNKLKHIFSWVYVLVMFFLYAYYMFSKYFIIFRFPRYMCRAPGPMGGEPPPMVWSHPARARAPGSMGGTSPNDMVPPWSINYHGFSWFFKVFQALPATLWCTLWLFHLTGSISWFSLIFYWIDGVVWNWIFLVPRDEEMLPGVLRLKGWDDHSLKLFCPPRLLCIHLLRGLVWSFHFVF